jgi:hypothetical protein
MSYIVTTPNGAQSPGLFPAMNNENFAVLLNIIGRDHIFNLTPMSGDNSGTHLQVTMTNRADPTTLPTGTNGILYLNNSSQLSLYNGTSIVQLSNPIRASVVMDQNANILGSSFNVTCSRTGNLFTISFNTALPSNNYLWSIAAYENGTSSSNNPLIVKVGTVNTTTFQFRVVNQNNSDASGVVTSITFIAFGG